LELPETYKGNNHQIINHDSGCKRCSLGCQRDNFAVRGCGPDNLSDVRLIVISDHPGYYERKHGYVMYDNSPSITSNFYGKKKAIQVMDWKNAGGYLRSLLKDNFALDTYTDVWITSAVKCDRLAEKSINESRHVAACVQQWLKPEMEALDEHAPHAPILIAGTHAYRSLKRLDSGLNSSLPNSLNDVRRRDDIKWRDHPVVFTFNPAAVCKLDMRIEDSVGLTETEKYKILAAKFWLHDLPRSPARIFKDDVLLLKEFLQPENESGK
jgi:uracil-DNA glycosylase